MVIKEVIVTQKFDDDTKHIKDASLKERIKKQIDKIVQRPDTGKPLRYSLKGEKSVYVKPYRLIYSVVNDTLILLRFMHRNSVYDKKGKTFKKRKLKNRIADNGTIFPLSTNTFFRLTMFINSIT